MSRRRERWAGAGVILVVLFLMSGVPRYAGASSSTLGLDKVGTYATPNVVGGYMPPPRTQTASGTNVSGTSGSGQAVSLESVIENLASGAGGGLLVFLLSLFLGGRNDRRDAKVAAQAVADELSMAKTTLLSGIKGASLVPAEAPAFDTDAFRAYRLLLYRRMDAVSMSKVVGAYRQLSGISMDAVEAASAESRSEIARDVGKAINALNQFSQRKPLAGPRGGG